MGLVYSRVLKLVGVNIIQGVIISGLAVIGKEVYRKLRIKRANEKYNKSCEEYYENNRDKPKFSQEN